MTAEFTLHELVRTAFLQLIFYLSSQKCVCPPHSLQEHLEHCRVYLQRFPVFVYKDVAIAYSYASHDLIFKTVASPTWQRKCSKVADCFHPALLLMSYCSCHIDEDAIHTTILDIVLRYSGATDWRSISKSHIQNLKLQLSESWENETSAHFKLSVEEDDVIRVRIGIYHYTVCDNFGKHNILLQNMKKLKN